MCEPTTILAITSIASTAFSVKSALDQSSFQEGTAKYNTRVAENESQDARNVATADENTQRQRTAELLSRQRAQLGAAGVDIGSGSALSLQEDAVTLGEADALRIRSRGDSQFASLQSEAELTEAQGSFAAAAGRNKAVGSLLSGAGATLNTGVADKWFTPKSAGNPMNINQGGGIGL